MAAALRAEVCDSKFMVRCVRTVGSIGWIRKGGSLGQGRKSLSRRLGSSDVISEIEALRDCSLVGNLEGVLSWTFGADASCRRKTGGDDERWCLPFRNSRPVSLEYGVKCPSEISDRVGASESMLG